MPITWLIQNKKTYLKIPLLKNIKHIIKLITNEKIAIWNENLKFSLNDSMLLIMNSKPKGRVNPKIRKKRNISLVKENCSIPLKTSGNRKKIKKIKKY